MQHEERFWRQWPSCVDSIQDLYENWFTLPNYRYELVHDRLQALRNKVSTNEIEKVLRQLWCFDERFFGELVSFADDDYSWAIYSLVYLGHCEAIIKNILAIYVPLLGRYVEDVLGNDFRTKIGATLMDDVGHYLWEVQGLIEPKDHALFDWHGNRNDMPAKLIERHLRIAGLSPFLNPDFPPRNVLLRFTNLQDPFRSDAEYMLNLTAFYRERGYDL